MHRGQPLRRDIELQLVTLGDSVRTIPRPKHHGLSQLARQFDKGFRSMKLHEILADKGSDVYSIPPSATLADMAEKLVQYNCGSLVVCDGGKMVGIITERDILRSFSATRKPLEQLNVADHMTRKVLTAKPDDDVSTTMGVMTEKRIRHLPVLNDGELVGMISIGDVVKVQHAQLSMENEFMKEYIQGDSVILR